MDNDQPRLAILGAGPIGLEAALYARYLGYPVQLFERGATPAESVLRLGEQRLPDPTASLVSSLGIAALQAQDSVWQCPAADVRLTAGEYRRLYLLPLAESDLVAEVLHLESEVLAVLRPESDSHFLIHYRNAQSEEHFAEADIVLDCTGAGSPVFISSESAESSEDLPGEFLNPASDYYVLGIKSVRNGEPLTYRQCLEQIRELFGILGEHEDLDVYATLKPGM